MEMKDWGLAWRELSEEAITGVKEWRLQNPKATFTEIERELDLRLAKLRGQGWPIGSGAVESGNKLVVEARLKGEECTGRGPM